MSKVETVTVEFARPVVIVSVNRPQKMNALNLQVLNELRQVFKELTEDERIRAAILTGQGKAFVAGADIGYMAEMTVSEAYRFSELGNSVARVIEEAPFPTLAAVNGFALGGGCELALCCDFIYASTKAKFGQPEVNLGLMPGFGGSIRLPRRVGVGHARELIYTGKTIGADEALRIGLVNRICDSETLLADALECAETIASKGPLGVAASKRSLLHGGDVPLSVANAYEREAFSGLFGSQDQKAGTQAFLEKREAEFHGR